MPVASIADSEKVPASWFQGVRTLVNTPFINVKDPAYDAKGDDAGDDTTALRLARDAAPAVGSDKAAKIVIPAGIYRLNPAALEDGDAVVLIDRTSAGDKEILWQGAGAGATILNCIPSAAKVFKIKGTTSDFVRRTNFRDMTIQGGGWAIHADSWGYSYVTRVTFNRQNNQALEATNSIGNPQQLDIDGCILHHTPGMKFRGLQNSRIRGNAIGEDIQGTNGIFIHGGQHIKVFGNSIWNVRGLLGGVAAKAGIEIRGEAGIPAQNVKVFGNTIRDVNEHGIVAQGDLRGCSIHDNNIEAPGQASAGAYDGILVQNIGSDIPSRLAIVLNTLTQGSVAWRKAISVSGTAVAHVLLNNPPALADLGINDASFLLHASASGMVIGKNGAAFKEVLSGTGSWDPPLIADGSVTTTTIAVAGAALGDLALVSFSLGLPNGAILTAAVTAANTVTVTLQNKTGGNLDLANGTLRCTVIRY